MLVWVFQKFYEMQIMYEVVWSGSQWLWEGLLLSQEYGEMRCSCFNDILNYVY